jgi:polyisoprenoid-binding protein YceI
MARYSIDPERSVVGIRAQATLHPIEAYGDGLSGWVEVEAAGAPGALDLSQKTTAEIQMPLARLSSGNRFEDQQLHKHVDATRFPSIVGVVTDVRDAGDPGRYAVRGDLTFHGRTRGCDGIVTVAVVDDRTIRIDGESSFDVRDFGIEPPRFLLFKVGSEVLVRITVLAELEPPS